MADIEKLDRIIDHIERHPEEWRQASYGLRTECGTAFCVAGHAAVLDRAELVWDFGTLVRVDGVMPYRYGQQALDLTEQQADELFDENNRLNTIKAMRDALAVDPSVPGGRLFDLAHANGDRYEDEDGDE